MLIYAS